MKPVKQALEDAKMSPNDIQEVVLVGRLDAHPESAALVRTSSAGKSPTRREPRRSRSGWRGDSGRSARRDVKDICCWT